MRSLPLVLLAACSTASAQSLLLSNSNAAGGKVEVPHAMQLVPQSGITVEAWITYDESTLGSSTNYRWPTIVRTGFVTAPNAFNFRVDAAQSANRVLKWTVNTTSGRAHARWTFSPGQLLNWTHVAATYDGSEIKLIVNGQTAASTPLTGDIIDPGHVIRIGQGADNAAPESECWNGNIDELRIWPFARTEAEIQATMNLELAGIPGLVSTWNFNNDAKDSSSTMDGALSGGAAYSANAPTLTPKAFPGVQLGQSTPGCLGVIQSGVSALPEIGNAAFGFVAHDVPASAQAIAVLSTTAASSPIRIAGIDLWVGLNGLIDGYPASVDSAGSARLTLPIAGGLRTGIPLVAQFVILDSCGPQGLTASNAVVVSTIN